MALYQQQQGQWQNVQPVVPIDNAPWRKKTGVSKATYPVQEPIHTIYTPEVVQPISYPAIQPIVEPAPATQSEEWPQSLKDYVTLVFSSTPPEQHDAAEQWLRNLIQTTTRNGSMWNIDWSSRSMPKLDNPALFKTSSTNANVDNLFGNSRKRVDLSDGKEESTIVPKKKRLSSISPITHGEEERQKREQRAKRFEEEAAAVQLKRSVSDRGTHRKTQMMRDDANVIDWDEHTIVGTSQQLEKPYLRLTSVTYLLKNLSNFIGSRPFNCTPPLCTSQNPGPFETKVDI